MEDIVALPNLRRFVIKLGWLRTSYYEKCIRVLHLREFNISNLSASKQNILRSAEYVCLECLHGGCKNVIRNMVGVVGGMNELTDLCFSRCSEIECLIDTTHGSFHVDALLPKLVNLVLLEMDNLKEMCRGPPLPVLGFFKKLEHLFIRKCQQLHSIVPEVVALDKDQQNHFTSNLRILELQELPQLKFICSCSTPRQVLSFQFLQLLKLDGCANLKSVFSMAIKRSLPELTSLSIYRCEKLEEIMAENEESQNLSNTEVCFPKLRKLVIKECNKLESLFSFAMFGMLPQLSDLHISKAAQLEVVFRRSSEDNTDNEDQIMLPKLRNLKLEKLPSFVSIFQGFKLQAPELQELSTNECPKFGLILGRTQRISFHHTTEKRQEVCLPRLIKIEVKQCNKLKCLFYDSMACHFPKLQSFVIKGCSQLEQVFGYKGEVDFGACHFPELQSFVIEGCSQLEQVFGYKGEVDFGACHFPKLQSFVIKECSQLEQVFGHKGEVDFGQQACCFPTLFYVEVKQCSKLKCLFYGFKACHFPELEYLEIKECSQLEQAIGFKIEAGDESFQREFSEDWRVILFRKLQLTVMDCPKYSLTSSDSRTSCLHITTEKGQVFWLITASSNSQAFLNLDVLNLTKSRAEGIFQLQVEGEISSNSERKPLISSLWTLRLCDLPELRFIWNGFSKFLSLEKLQDVSLVECPKLKTVFSSCLVSCLPNLWKLLISNCEELEEIISSDSKNAQLRHPSVCRQQVCFPRLIKIEVKQCNKLKCLFYDSMDCHFPELKSLEIEECSQIEQVFGSNGGADDESSQRWANEDGDRILFPKLNELVLKSLPIFFEISRGFNLQQPLHKYPVIDCPKYNSIFAEASTSYWHTTTQGEYFDEEPCDREYSDEEPSDGKYFDEESSDGEYSD